MHSFIFLYCVRYKKAESHNSAFPLSYRIELILTYSTDWANPILRNILEGCAWSDTTIGVAYRWVVDPSTHGANILFHINFQF